MEVIVLLRITMPEYCRDCAGELACLLAKPAPVKDVSPYSW